MLNIILSMVLFAASLNSGLADGGMDTRDATGQALTQAFASPSRIVVAYVSGKDAVSRRRFIAVRGMWASMQTEYARWSLRCLLVIGGYEHARFKYDPDPICPTLSLNAPDEYKELGHKVKALIAWASAHLSSFDYLMKTDMDTLVCFSTILDKLDSLALRFGSRERVYLGRSETCSPIHHHQHARFYDASYLEDIFFREDAPCYPPYMQGLGYVLSRDVVELLARRLNSLKVFSKVNAD